ncbi:MAG: hypothetical protein IAE95_11605 [Chitinophagaceae bacterium]|nr:hypothetical protein [Chitinophagaceae bacterium]
MKYVVCFVLLVFCAGSDVMGQALIPFKYTSEEENRLIKENDTLRYYIATGDTVNVVALNEEAMYYKLVNRKDKKKVVAEGGLIADGEGYLQHGRWVQYYNSGKTAISGSYIKGKPAGIWEEYYPDGRLKVSGYYAIISDKDGITTCRSGEYLEYYSNGQLKVSGYYAADRTVSKDSTTVEDPVSGKMVTKTISKSYYSPKKAGSWDHYSEAGEVEKHEEF